MAIQTVPEGRSMPFDQKAEASVLSAMTVSPDVAAYVMAQLGDEDLYLPRHRTIYKAMRGMAAEGVSLDPITLADRLSKEGTLDQVGGRAYLVELGSDTFSLASYKDHVGIVLRDSARRRLIMGAAEALNAAWDDSVPLKEATAKVLSSIDRATEQAAPCAHVSHAEVARADAERLFEGEAKGVPCGIDGLDRLTHGLRPGQMMIVGAGTGIGKSVFATHAAVVAAKLGCKVAFFSLEMTKEEVSRRLAANAERSFDLGQVASGAFKGNASLRDAYAGAGMENVEICDTGAVTVAQMRAEASRILRGAPEGKRLIVLDYVQLMTPEKRTNNRTQDMTEISRAIKAAAKDLHAPVIALVQLNRQLESRADRRPRLGDVRETGALEQDCDMEVLLDRSRTEEEALESGRPAHGFMELRLVKNRGGLVGDARVRFDGAHSYLEDEASFYARGGSYLED